MAGPVWFKVRKELGHQPIAAGRIPGSTPLFCERYLYQDIERTVSGIDCIALVVQFGGGRVTEGEPDRWRSMNLPTQSLLLPRRVPTHWHYSGTVDFAVFYFLEGGSEAMQRLEVLAQPKDAPIPFSDPLVGAAALQLVGELQKAHGAEAGFMERLAGVMLEQTFRVLVTPATRGINPRHVHFSRLQSVLNHVHTNIAADLSARATRPARGSQPGPFQPHLPGRHGRFAAPVRAGGAARPRPQAPDAVDAAHLPDRRRVRVQFAEPLDSLLSHRAFDDAGPVPGALQATKRAYEVTQGDSLDRGQARLLHYTPPLAGGPPPVEATVRLPLSAEALKIYLWSNGVEPLKLLVTAG